MQINSDMVALVTGGASGLGRATAEALAAKGAKVVIVDLPTSDGEAVAKELGGVFAPADVTREEQMNAALDAADKLGALRAVVHCAGRGLTVRVLDKEGNPGSLADYTTIINLNLIGSFNVLRLAAARMAKNELVDDERGVVIMTASIAAWEGQIGQIPYASSKAGVVGMTLVAARDLSGKQIRVNTIAPGVFHTPILNRHPQEVIDKLASGIPNPRRLGRPNEFAMMAQQLIENPYVNGETIRVDAAYRMPAK
jgi:NAD(P)-dependent dehydrogenase (short-subunit alcohol dehydrogenase family)